MNEQKPRTEKNCQLCGKPWHIGVACAEEIRAEDQRKLDELLKSGTTPKGKEQP